MLVSFHSAPSAAVSRANAPASRVDHRRSTGTGASKRIDKRLIYSVVAQSLAEGGFCPRTSEVLRYLVAHANRDGAVIASQLAIATATGNSVSTAKRALLLLESLSFLWIEHRRNVADGHYLPTRYHLSLSPSVAFGVVGPKPAKRPYPAPRSLENLVQNGFHAGSVSYGGRDGDGDLLDRAAYIADQMRRMNEPTPSVASALVCSRCGQPPPH